jgi:hypothetical protein
MKLIKRSYPGWISQNLPESEVKDLLYSQICLECREGSSEYGDPKVFANSSISEMLSTACGCEFMVEE